MAYTFDRINGLMAGQDGEEQKSDIFSPQQGQAQTGNAGLAGTAGPSGAIQKTSTQGELPMGDTAGGAGGAQTNVTQSDVLDKNRIEAQPGFTNQLSGQIGKAGNDLQNEADVYMRGQAAKGLYDSGAGLDLALRGDDSQFSSINNLLHSGPQKADMYQSGINTNFADVDKLNDRGALQTYLQKQGGEGYGRGMAGLDATIFARDPNYQQNISNIKLQRDALADKARQLREGRGPEEGSVGLQTQAQRDIDARYGVTTNQIRADLARKEAEQMSAAQQRQAEENQLRNLRHATGNRQFVMDQGNALLTQLRAEHPELSDNLVSDLLFGQGGPENIDADRFYQTGANVNLDQAISPEQASYFNRIEQLLNKGTRYSGADLANGRDQFDTEGFKKSALEQAALRKARMALPKPVVGASSGVPINNNNGGFYNQTIEGVSDYLNKFPGTDIGTGKPNETLMNIQKKLYGGMGVK